MDHEIGPALPPGMRKAIAVSNLEADDDIIGPSLPPHLMKSAKSAAVSNGRGHEDKETADYAPALPPHLNKSRDRAAAAAAEHLSELQDDSSSEDDFIGPSVAMAAEKDSVYDAAAEFAARNRMLEKEKRKKEEAVTSSAGSREEWMTALPTTGLPQDIGLTARTFRNKAAAEQDESWTLTPEERKKRAAEKAASSGKKRDLEDKHASQRDDELSKKISRYNESKRAESLMEMHQKKLKKDKKKKAEDGKPLERVPFSRETDLQVNRFDEAQRKSIMKKAALLDTRFSHGSKKYE